MAAVLKTVEGAEPSVGSNPTLSANKFNMENCSKKEFPRGRAHRVLQHMKRL